MAVLVLDDEQNILNAVKRELASEPFSVFTATDCEEAFQILEKEKIKVVVSDHRLFCEKRPSFLEQVRKLYPNVIRIQFMGYSDPQVEKDSISLDGVFRFIKKPWDGTALKTSIREAIECFDLSEKSRSFLALAQKRIEELSLAHDQFKQTCLQHQKFLKKLHIDIRGKLEEIVEIIRQIGDKAPSPKDELLLTLNMKINFLIPLFCKPLDNLPTIPSCQRCDLPPITQNGDNCPPKKNTGQEKSDCHSNE